LKIEVEKSGGFAGIIKKVKVDTERLTEVEGDHVKRMARKCDFRSIRNKNKNKDKIPRGSADYVVYRISIVDGKKRFHTECNDFTIDKTLRTLINYLLRNSA
jgi:hypothetical protein